MVKRYIYRINEIKLGEILAETGVPLEILKREGDIVEVASYKPLKNLSLLRVEELEEDWENWKKGFGPVEVEDFVILPPWKEVIFINPARAFGTGLHPTTQLCLKLLREYVKEGDRVLDIGTGSGILAIVSKKLGAGEVIAIDISPDAVQECKENSKLNGVSIECLQSFPSDISGSFDLVLANLELSIFREELRNIVPRIRSIGIFSGLYGREELEEFLDMLGKYDLSKDKILELENWYGVSVKT